MCEWYAKIKAERPNRWLRFIKDMKKIQNLYFIIAGADIAGSTSGMRALAWGKNGTGLLSEILILPDYSKLTSMTSFCLLRHKLG